MEQGITPIASTEVLCSVKECPGQQGIFKNISDSYISKTHRLEDDRSIFPASALIGGATIAFREESGSPQTMHLSKNCFLSQKQNGKNSTKLL